MANIQGPTIGIDLGTRWSCVGIFRDGRMEVIPNEQGNKHTASCVSFTKSGRLVGDSALSQITSNPTNTIYDFKQLIGRKFDDITPNYDKHLLYKISTDNFNNPTIEVNHKSAAKTFTPEEYSSILLSTIRRKYIGITDEVKAFRPEEITSMVLTKMRKTAETYLGMAISNAVIIVPAHFNNSQRKATIDAATISGLNVLRIINEPSAAVLAQYYNVTDDQKRNVLVFALGASSFDVSIVVIENGIFEVKANIGTQLGGNDFDGRLFNFVLSEINRKFKNRTLDHRALQRIRTECERAKNILSSYKSADIEIDFLFDGIDFKTTITRDRFEELNCDLFRYTIVLVIRALRVAGMKKEDISDILMVGGCVYIPKIQQLLREFFVNEEINKTVAPKDVIVCGAAIQAAIMKHHEPSLEHLLLLDVTPHSIGVNDKGGVMVRIISHNTSLPYMAHHTFVNNSPQLLTVSVFMGERIMTRDNKILGNIELTHFKQNSNSGNYEVEVKFNVDCNGILSITNSNNNDVIVKIINDRRTNDEVKRMITEAERHRIDDEDSKNSIVTNNNLESQLFKYTNNLNNNEKLQTGVRVAITTKDYPKTKLSHEELQVIHEEIGKRIDEIESGLPHLEYESMTERIMYFICHDQTSAAWLTGLTGFQVNGRTLRTLSLEILTKPVEMVWKTNDLSTNDVSKLQQRLQKYHPNICINKWTVLNTISNQIEKYFYILVDEESSEYIRKAGYRLPSGVGQSTFSHLDSDDTNNR